MNVISIGTDLVSISRVTRALARYGSRLAARLLSDNELDEFNRLHTAQAAFLARRFAAREAAAKALGSGIAGGVSWRDFEVGNDARGAPCLRFTAGARRVAEHIGANRALLSLSDEGDYALAFVVLTS